MHAPGTRICGLSGPRQHTAFAVQSENGSAGAAITTGTRSVGLLGYFKMAACRDMRDFGTVSPQGERTHTALPTYSCGCGSSIV